MSSSDNWTDKEVVVAFTRMLRTVLIWLPWLIITLYFALFKQWAYWGIAGVSSWIHVAFYVWIIVSFPVLYWVTKRKVWRM